MKKLCLLILAVAAVVWLGLNWYGGIAEFETAEHVANVSWLPSAATDISFYNSYQFTAYEFSISEAEFRKLASDKGWELRELAGEEREIYRYRFGRLGNGGQRAQPPMDASKAEWDAYWAVEQADKEARAKTIKHGLYYQQLQSNGGGVTVGYDRAAGRAYFTSSPR